jgi:hypothetical protein
VGGDARAAALEEEGEHGARADVAENKHVEQPVGEVRERPRLHVLGRKGQVGGPHQRKLIVHLVPHAAMQA